MYVIIDHSDYLGYHDCDGIYTSRYEAIGHIVCLMDDEILYWQRSGYKLSKRTDYWYGEARTCREWSIDMIPGDNIRAQGREPVHVDWYLFEADVDEEVGKTAPATPVRDEDLPF